MFAKEGTYRSESWRRAVASLDCMCCKRSGPSQAAHVNHRGKGMGMKAPDCWTFPLCPSCHSEFDQGVSYTRKQRRELADEWVMLTVLELAKRGLVRP